MAFISSSGTGSSIEMIESSGMPAAEIIGVSDRILGSKAQLGAEDL